MIFYIRGRNKFSMYLIFTGIVFAFIAELIFYVNSVVKRGDNRELKIFSETKKILEEESLVNPRTDIRIFKMGGGKLYTELEYISLSEQKSILLKYQNVLQKNGWRRDTPVEFTKGSSVLYLGYSSDAKEKSKTLWTVHMMKECERYE